MNSVHEHHDPDSFRQLRHFVFAFHDSTFECVAGGFTVELHDGPLTKVVSAMSDLLAQHG